jgi:hypothetical protein
MLSSPLQTSASTTVTKSLFKSMTEMIV